MTIGRMSLRCRAEVPVSKRLARQSQSLRWNDQSWKLRRNSSPILTKAGFFPLERNRSFDSFCCYWTLFKVILFVFYVFVCLHDYEDKVLTFTKLYRSCSFHFKFWVIFKEWNLNFFDNGSSISTGSAIHCLSSFEVFVVKVNFIFTSVWRYFLIIRIFCLCTICSCQFQSCNSDSLSNHSQCKSVWN